MEKKKHKLAAFWDHFPVGSGLSMAGTLILAYFIFSWLAFLWLLPYINSVPLKSFLACLLHPIILTGHALMAIFSVNDSKTPKNNFIQYIIAIIVISAIGIYWIYPDENNVSSDLYIKIAGIVLGSCICGFLSYLFNKYSLIKIDRDPNISGL